MKNPALIAVLIGAIAQALLNMYIMVWTVIGFLFAFFIGGSSFFISTEYEWFPEPGANEFLQFVSTMAILFMVFAAIFLVISLTTNVLTFLAVHYIRTDRRHSRTLIFLIIATITQVGFGLLTLFEPITCSLFFITALCYLTGILLLYKTKHSTTEPTS
ncbi:hypothetical protein N780_09940 [Pontibacillus chungwhensis BH030062]|uniref:Uncharacterized protein n=1 Tax=Pontibacillus chungwhensis BH030062 TaxID=1385513 RepID=A0A0A2UTK1_9BACI|nr:hypothetical protein [Pontibacillus chungwhensis]KGP89801.1 hypothetical protein N780_09940 [Pontibacillus chungwhensis BH030062]